jgi:outer membrane protein assembly factor BamB
MVVKKYGVLTIIIAALLQSCTQIDDYMLGKDNTPQPTPLAPIKEKVTLTEKWSVPTGKPSNVNDALKLSPVVSGHVVYTANVDGAIQATNQSNGNVIWSKQLPVRLISGPTVGSGHIAVATNRSTVMVLNQADGSTLWQANVSGDSLSMPLITGRYLIVKSIDGTVYNFNLKTGEKVWVSDHGAPSLILKASSSPVMMGKLVLVGFSDGKLDAIDLETGRVMWQRNIAYASGGSDVERLVDIDADPIVRGDTVYLGSYQGYVGALSLTNGEFIWRNPASIYKDMSISGDALYYVDNDGVIWARNRSNGHVIWKQEAFKAHGLTEPVLFGQYLFIGDKDGYVHGLNVHNGQMVSRTFLHAPIIAAPVVSDSTLYILTTNGKLSRFALRS